MKIGVFGNFSMKNIIILHFFEDCNPFLEPFGTNLDPDLDLDPARTQDKSVDIRKEKYVFSMKDTFPFNKLMY